MSETEAIAKKYKELPTETLLELAADPYSLRPDAIPFLQDELLSRNQKEEALLLTSYLIEKPKLIKDYTSQELKELIKERVENGEAIQSIKMDLKEQGVDFFELLDEENRNKEKTFEYIVTLKDEGLEDDEIAEILQSEFSIDEEQTIALKQQLKKKGKQNIIIGICLVVLMLMLTFTAMGLGGNIGASAVLLLLTGLFLIAKGSKQVR